MTREEAKAYFKRHIDLYCVTGICREAEEMAIQALEQEPKTGHWVGIDEEPHEDYECDNCGFIHTFIDGHTAQYNYCPNCGADMSEVEE